jgi:hypothetical protein
VRLVYAPNVPIPLDVTYEMSGRGERLGPAWFDHAAIRDRYSTRLDYAALARGAHFFEAAAAWNGATCPA